MTEGPWGVRYLGDGKCEWRIWAPLLRTLSLRILSAPERYIELECEEDGCFFARANGIVPGTRYCYQFSDGHERPDPWSSYQPEGIFGPSCVVDHTSFLWQDGGWRAPPLQELIIYEVHVGAFTQEGTFGEVRAKLSYLQDLGINAIEIMPIAQFPGERDWGYDGVYPFAVQNTYGGPEEFKKLVNDCHEKGISVILDVVYNHLGPEGNFLSEFMPCLTDVYKTPWGQAMNLDQEGSYGTRKLWIDNALFWFEHFHVDMLRLDAIHGIIDMSAKHFLKELSEQVEELARSKGKRHALIAESDLNDSRVIASYEKGGYGIEAQWNDDFHHALHTLLTGEAQGYYQDFGKLSQLAKALREGFVYTWEYSPFRKRYHGSSSKEFLPSQFVIFSQNHDQVGNRAGGERLSLLTSFEGLKTAAGAVILSRNIPFLFMGEEYGEEAPFLYFASFYDEELRKSVRQGRERLFKKNTFESISDPFSSHAYIDSKLQWDRTKQEKGRCLYSFYKRLFAIRKEHRAITQPTFYEVKEHDPSVLSITGLHEQEGILVVMNVDRTKEQVISVEREGRWEKLFDSASSEWLGSGSALPLSLSGIQDVCLNPLHFGIYKKTL